MGPANPLGISEHFVNDLGEEADIEVAVPASLAIGAVHDLSLIERSDDLDALLTLLENGLDRFENV